MADSDILRNLTAAAIQMACLAVFAEALLRVIPVAAAGFRYGYWRLVLVGAFVLPWLLRTPPAAGGAALTTVTSPAEVGFVPIAATAAAVAPSGISALAWLPWLLAAGTALRLLWIAVGLVRLRAARRKGAPVVDAEYEEIQERLGTRADIRAVPGLAQPVTFGVRRPVVLLPPALAQNSLPIRRAAVAHELIHVQRRDWALLLSEEMLRAIFWFHPAIWWLTARVRLAREEFTDHLAVLATGDRRAYIDALLAFAGAPHLAPAEALVHRTHLFDRILLLTKESGMSSRRIAVSTIVLALLLGAGGWYASEAFPVRAARSIPAASRPAVAARQSPPSVTEVRPITPENPIPRRLFGPPIPYPLELAGTGFESALSIRVVLDENGSVQSAFAGSRAVAAPGRRQPLIPESDAMNVFATAAVDAIQRWQYEPPVQAPIAFYLAVVFKPDAAATISQTDRPQGVRAGPEGARMLTRAEQAEVAAQALARRAARPTGAARSGGPFAPSGASTGAPTPGPPAGAGPSFEFRPRGAAVPGPGRGQTPNTAPPAAGQARRRALEETITVGPGGPVRVGGSVMHPTQIRKVHPVYPEEARAARVQGVVILETIIDQQGRVGDIRVLRSIPQLDQAAIDAVRQWEYTPTLLNGLPVPIVLTTAVQFRLE